ncbi:scavenger receptor class B member 1-like isoform X3 [Sitodiplosis mosellana]|uniref:scavenger receptor class B member 1-like isoform X3 n=1 Tax=Sitodiplosis mosellana TaxID=263140 RepID=UPI0024438EE9|nr:scavenger receptor class B member 1-like isoform X3 [Sitodiplosis mosellana]
MVHCRRSATCHVMFILIVVFLISGAVFFVMWFTELYNDSIVSSLVLAKNSTALHYFIQPPLNPQLKVHIFNYTNTERFLDGLDKKLIVKDIGPFVYTEKTQKVEVVYNDNNTISYREHRSFDFRPELSAAHQFVPLIVPNVPFLTAAWQSLKWDYLKTAAFNVATFAITLKPFVHVPAHSFLWGYDDPLIEISKTYGDSKPKFDKFGMLVTRNGTSEETFTVNSGVDDIRKLNVIDNFKGQPRMNFWSTNECNRVDGSDGSQFPPHLMDKKHKLEVFIKAFCRKFPMVYDSEVSLFNGVPAYRYKAPRNVFDNPDKNPANECYCDIGSGKCAPSGVFNATLCFDAPIYSSFPHFLYGDDKLFENIDGLSPNENEHLTFADVHPRLAFPMAGSSRFQINAQVHKAERSELNRFENEQILPVMWMEVTSDEVPEELRAMIYHSTFSANAIQMSLRYGSLFGLAVSVTMLVAGCYLKNTESDQGKFKGIKDIKKAGTVTIEELVTIDLNDPLRTHTESNYLVKE